MGLLIAGILLWSVTHLLVAMGSAARGRLVGQIGLPIYTGLFSLLIVASLVLIVKGWQASSAASVWLPPTGLRHLTLLLMPIAVILFSSARLPTDIKRVLRHPQLTGVKLWAVAHLLANGEQRSIVLFGSLLAWAVLEVIFINRRDGAWAKPAPVGGLKTTISAFVGLGIAGALMFGHRWFAGVALF